MTRPSAPPKTGIRFTRLAVIGTLSATMTTLGDSTAGGDAAEPGTARQLAQLRQHIQKAHLQAGRPSYREISRRTSRAVSHTTASKIIQCEGVPTWAPLEQVLNALDGDVAAARELWVAVHQPPPAAGSQTATAAGTPAAPSTEVGPSITTAVPDDRAPRPARRARRSSRQSQTTVFTLGTGLFMSDFYHFLAAKITAARHCVYITGVGVADDPEGEALHEELVTAVRAALSNGAHVVRVQITPIVTDCWFSHLHALVTQFPQTFELRALTTPATITPVSLCAIDVDDPDRNVAEMMIQTPRYRGTRRLNPASTAVFVEGHQLLAQSFRDQIIDLGTTEPATHLGTGPAVERFFRGEYYFAYGSNMDTAQMTQRCPTALPIGPVLLHDHRLVFNRSGTYRPGGVANLEPASGHRVYGMLWKLSADDLRGLDDTEDPRAYHRSKLTVYSLTGQPHTGVHVYLATPDRDDDIPDTQYLDVVITAGRTVGLPPEYIQELETRRPTNR
jgi:hypothetical protein